LDGPGLLQSDFAPSAFVAVFVCLRLRLLICFYASLMGEGCNFVSSTSKLEEFHKDEGMGLICLHTAYDQDPEGPEKRKTSLNEEVGCSIIVLMRHRRSVAVVILVVALVGDMLSLPPELPCRHTELPSFLL
jgi:hypothetical protein